jgi:hypothetical protein
MRNTAARPSLSRIVRREQNAVGFGPVDNRPYEFTDGVKTVGDLWQEWQEGIGGRMPVKNFEPKHTGSRAHKDRWTQRKPIYELLATLVRCGHAPCKAIHLVESSYPRLKVTALGRQIRKDTRNGTLPRALRV